MARESKRTRIAQQKFRQKVRKARLAQMTPEQIAKEDTELYQGLQSLLPFKAISKDCKHNEKVFVTHLLGFQFRDVDKSACFELFSNNFARAISSRLEAEENQTAYFILPHLQRHFHSFKIPRFVEQNFTLLRECFNLSKFHTDLLHLLHIFKDNRSYFNGDNLPYHKVIDFLALCLRVKRSLVKQALAPNGVLRKFELIEVHEVYDFLYECTDFIDELFREPFSKEKILKKVALPVPPSTLELEDFAYMREELDMLLDICHKIPNPSIYLYGAPGVGKNELVKLIAKVLNREIYDIYEVDENGDFSRKKDRFERLYMAQSLLDSRKHIVLVDECEDIFTRFSLMQSLFCDASGGKSRDNKLIESIRVPSFFLSNSVDLDPALLRRFSLVLEVCAPPKDKKRALICKTLEGAKITLDSTLLEAIVESNLTQGVLLKAAELTNALSKRGRHSQRIESNNIESISTDSKDSHNAEFRADSKANTQSPSQILTKSKRQKRCEYLQEVFLKVLNEQLKALGKPEIAPNRTPTLPYSLSLINASVDVAKLAANLKKMHCGMRILAYGIAGSGKSAYAKALAKELDKPIILKKASDIFSKYVGDNEKNIARAFEEARKSGAILVLDEVDSFLCERGEATHGWEVRQVNEMLTQMESFEGIFIATTNLVENLDRASIRRFDYKIEFKALDSKRLSEAFAIYAEFLGLRDSEGFLRTQGGKLERLSNICFGDFALIARGARLEPLKDSQSLYEKLLAESKLKDSQKGAKIGLI